MATTININGKLIKRPGVYASVKSGIKRSPASIASGNICIIDTGLGAGFAGGAGFDGENSQQSIYEFSSIQDFRAFVKGGPLFDIALPLFNPANSQTIQGVSKIYLIKSATTTSATITIPFLEDTVNVVIKTKDEGIGANGVLTGGVLSNGYGVSVVPGIIDDTKFMVEFYHGNFKGTDSLNNVPYDNKAAGQTPASLLFRSIEFSNVSEFTAWMNSSNIFNEGFILETGGAGVVVEEDLSVGLILATGATEVYNPLTPEILQLTDKLDHTFYLALDNGAEATGANNVAIFDFLKSSSRFERFMVVAGGYDKSTYAGQATTTSQGISQFYDSNKVINVHGGVTKGSRTGVLLKNQLYHAALVMGRMCGLDPQVPLTFKRLDTQGVVHELSGTELDFALDKGIIVSFVDPDLGYTVIQQGVNTLQDNQYLVDEVEGISFDVSVERIKAQLNKEIVVRAKQDFFTAENGPNRGSLSTEDLATWTDGFLSQQVTNGLIVDYRNIIVTVDQDTYYVNYQFVPNYPISKFVFTGVILEN